MKKNLLPLGMVLVACAVAPACVTTYNPTYTTQPPVQVADPEPVAPAAYESEPFYADLAPYGDWVWVEGPGWVWSPSNVQAGWRPYEQGHWVLTDYGWTWDSNENVGWVVYHYGRWHDDPYRGWVWVPGTEWGPAWVAWHEGGGWVGWAPLPWQVGWQAGVGLNWGGVNINVALGASSWHFVEARNMVDVAMYNHYAPTTRNVTLIQNTTNVTNYTYIDNRIVNNSVPPQKIGRAVGHEIHRCRVIDADDPGQAHGQRGNGEEFVAYRPNPGRRGRMSVDRPVQANPERSNPDRSEPDHSTEEQAPPQRMAPPLHPAKPVPGWQRRVDSTQRTREQAAHPPAPPAPAEQDRPPSEPVRGRPNGAPAGHQHGNPNRSGQPPRPAAPSQPDTPTQAGAPAQSAAPAQAAAPARPAAPAQPAAPGRSATRPPTPASAPTPATANTPTGQARPKSAPGAGAQHGKKKPDAPKPDAPKPEEPESDKPEQNR